MLVQIGRVGLGCGERDASIFVSAFIARTRDTRGVGCSLGATSPRVRRRCIFVGGDIVIFPCKDPSYVRQGLATYRPGYGCVDSLNVRHL